MARTAAEDEHIESTQAPLIEHLTELRIRLIRALQVLIVVVIALFFFASEIFDIIAAPLREQLVARGLQPNLLATTMEEPFFIHLKIAVYSGLFVSFPFIALQLWRFVAPGLYQNEKTAFWPFLVATPVLFALGGALVYFVVSPLVFGFFIDYALSSGGVDPGGDPANSGIRLEQKVSEYISLVMKFMLGFGIAFQLPVLLTLLGKAGIVSHNGLVNGRKYAIVGIAAAAAVLTPPDPISQLLLGLPLYVLYEISIILVKGVEKKRDDRLREDGYYDDDV